jgi:hypothetical protein
MINHFRTLLLNRKRDFRPVYGDHGEEYIPEEFEQLELPADLVRIRNVLLGEYGDPLYENYRMAQYLTLIHTHATLWQYIVEHDDRITYDINAWQFSRLKEAITVSPNSNTEMELRVMGKPTADDEIGRISFSYIIGTSAGPSVDIHNVKDHLKHAEDISITDQVSTTFPIGNGMTGQLLIPAGSWAEDMVFHVMALVEPSYSLGDIYNILDTRAAQYINPIMREQDEILQDLWRNGHGITDTLGAALVGYVNEVHKVYAK